VGYIGKDEGKIVEMSKSLKEFIQRKISSQVESGLNRELKTGSEALVDFASNDYLGLARSRELRELIQKEIDENNLYNGSTGSRLLTGNSQYAEQIEHTLAHLFNAEAGLVMNSGYAANLAVLSSLPQKDDTIIYDELAHASIKDGARLSLARRFSFRHNDIEDLKRKILKASGRVFIAIESIYSMDGDEAPLADICDVADRYDCCVILDEAHSTGVYGMGGNGIAVLQNVHSRIFVRIYTFGKAMGLHGAFVAGNLDLKKYLINFSRPFIYTTAPSPHSFASINVAFKYLKTMPHLATRLFDNIHLYTDELSLYGRRSTTSRSAIQTVIIPGNEHVRRVAHQLQSAGFDVRPILSPTVSKGAERLRICLHSFNTSEEIAALVRLLNDLR
jgi:8-amino-7-oxononanoate synthase